MVLEGGVAGAQPLHKGGRLRPTAHNTTLVESLQACQGCFSLEYCKRQSQSIREVTRRAAKNTRGEGDFHCAAAGPLRSGLLPQITVVADVNGP